MKSILTVLVAFIICCASANAQIRFGIKGGICVSTLEIEPKPYGPEYTSSLYPAGGIFASIGFSPLPLSIQSELLYVVKGAERSVSDSNSYSTTTGEQSFKFQYIEIPVLLKFTIPLAGPVTPNFFAGPAFGFLVGSEHKESFVLKSKNGQIIGSPARIENPIPDTNEKDFSIVFGAGVDFNLFTTKFTVDGRYTMGIDDITTNINQNSTMKNRAWVVMLGIAF